MIRLGLRNAWRSKSWLATTAALIAAPVFLLLVLQAVADAVERQTAILKRTVDNTLQLRARGSMGHVNMEGNKELLPQRALGIAQRAAHVSRVEHYLLAMTPTEGHNFAMIVGVNPGETKRLESHGEAGNPRLIAGRDLTEADRGQRIAVIGQGVARWAGITAENLGQATLTLDLTRTHPVIFALKRPPVTLRIVGIYASGYVFGDLQLFMPLNTFREVYGVPEGISWLYVQADSVDNVRQVETALRRDLGEVADIIGPTAAAEFEATATRTVRRLAAGGAAIAALLMALVVFFVTLVNVRDRTRELGTLKALGASAGGIAASVIAEAFALAVLGTALGAALFALLGNLFARPFFAIAVRPFLAPQYRDTLADALVLGSSSGVQLIAWAALAAIAATLIGSAWGLRQAIRLSPVEALRHE
ncbi:MAG: ABC transporter permease [Burkholderiales bacterium]